MVMTEQAQTIEVIDHGLSTNNSTGIDTHSSTGESNEPERSGLRAVVGERVAKHETARIALPYDEANYSANQPRTPAPGSPAAAALISLIHQLAERYWHQPDHQALDVILAFIGAYYLHERNPLWLHIIGESSSGKTELGMAPIALDLPEFHAVDDLTANTLISGLTKGRDGGKQNSLLHRIGMFGVVYMEDFTTFLGKDERMVDAVAGQLRRVYDGRHIKEVGVGRRDNADSDWQGRISWITAMTPGAERKWMKHNDMGERFSIIRWRAATNHELVSRKILAQAATEAGQRYLDESRQVKQEQIAGPRKWIGWLSQRLIQGRTATEVGIPPTVNQELVAQFTNQLEYLEDANKPQAPGEELVFDGGLYALAEIVTQLRSVPSRPDGRNIGLMADRESSGRLQHQLLKVARGWAFMHRREVEASDMVLVRRVAADSIPLHKRAVVEVLLQGAAARQYVDNQSLLERSGYRTQEALAWQLQDLEALGVIETPETDLDRRWKDWSTEWRLTEQFEELWKRGFGGNG